MSSHVTIQVDNLTYQLLGEVSSSSDEDCADFEKYLISEPQVMAKTKNTFRKTDNKGQLISEGGKQLAIKSPPRRSARLGHDANRTGFTSDEGSTSEGGSSRSKRKRDDDDPNPKPGKQPRQIIPTKNLTRIPRPKLKPSMSELCKKWNRKARIGLTSETRKAWLKKTDRKRDQQGHVLRRLVPGSTALREIKFYQRCQAFLIPMLPFSRLVHEVCQDCEFHENPLRWQANAIFSLQCAAEAYLAGFLMDVNLCALHRKVVTIDRKDVWLAIQVRGREQVGCKPNVSDTGMHSTATFMSSDPSEKAGHEHKLKKGQRFRYETTPNQEWNDMLLTAARLKMNAGKTQAGTAPKTRTLRRRTLIHDNLRAITKASICRLARRGGVKRMTGHIYDLVRGVLKLFLIAVVKDAIIYAEHCKRRTVTAIDIAFALKNHGQTLYGFIRR